MCMFIPLNDKCIAEGYAAIFLILLFVLSYSLDTVNIKSFECVRVYSAELQARGRGKSSYRFYLLSNQTVTDILINFFKRA